VEGLLVSGRVLVERVEGYATPMEWRRAYHEINDFERMLLEDDTPLVKIFLHITPEEQMHRFRARLTDPLKRWKLSYEDFRNHGRWKDYEAAIEDMIETTSTKRAPGISCRPTTSRSAGSPDSASSLIGYRTASLWSRARSIRRWRRPPSNCSVSGSSRATIAIVDAARGALAMRADDLIERVVSGLWATSNLSQGAVFQFTLPQ
jgi:hypothetical protein